MHDSTWMTITCGACGHNADIDEWTRTEIAGELPRNEYQCPACRCAFERRPRRPTVHPNGWVEPGDIDLVTVEARL